MSLIGGLLSLPMALRSSKYKESCTGAGMQFGFCSKAYLCQRMLTTTQISNPFIPQKSRALLYFQSSAFVTKPAIAGF